mgnify:FL=1|jgi:putative transposase
MARVLGVSQSGYYKWLGRQEKGADAKKEEEEALTLEILELFQRSRGSFGCRKITKKLNETREQAVNHKKVERIMREEGLFAKSRKPYLPTTNSKHHEWIADNLLNRDFTAEKPKQKLVSDTTVVPTKEGDLYVAGILDLYARMPVGIAMSLHNDSQLVKDALEDFRIRGGAEEGCILHSDRGSTYASKEYRILLSKYGFLCSMSRKGDCWDNAPMESFWGKLKTEWLKEKYATIQEAAKDIYEYVWMFYPKERPNQALGYRTPFEVYFQAECT